jgi:selenide, water dikinase
MEGSSIIVKDLLLVGGGHTHVHTIKMLGMDPIEGVRVTLITRDLETPYSGMLPGYVAGYYTHEECHIDLVKLCAFGNVRLIHAEACDMNVFEKVVYCKDNRPPVRYDVVSIDIGISPIPMSQVWGNSSINEGGSSITPVKPIDGFAARWTVILDRIMAMAAQQHQQQQDFHLRIVGGGGGGVELAFALHHRLHTELSKRGARDAQRRLKVSILHRGNALMSSHKPAVQAIIARRLKEKNIAVHLGAEVAEASTEGSHKSLRTTTGASFAYDEVIWCTGGRAQPWLRDVEGLSTTEEGFIRVGPTLESESIQDVYAAGDVCHLVESPRPKAGVFAVRAGPPLTANLRGRLLGRPAEEQVRWVPQADFLGIVGVGDGEAVASKGPLGIEGAFVWKLKDRIDRLWMKMYALCCLPFLFGVFVSLLSIYCCVLALSHTLTLTLTNPTLPPSFNQNQSNNFYLHIGLAGTRCCRTRSSSCVT